MKCKKEKKKKLLWVMLTDSVSPVCGILFFIVIKKISNDLKSLKYSKSTTGITNKSLG